MALSDKHMRHVCQYGKGAAQCRYITEDINDNEDIVCICLKLSVLKQDCDDKVFVALHDGDRQAPVGNNCPGYPKLLHNIQGYDVK